MAWSKQIFNEINNFTTCTERELLYKVTVVKRSWFSVIGLGNFYSEHYYDGVFELVEGLITAALVFIWPRWLCEVQECLKTFISGAALFLLLLCHTVDVVYMVCEETFKLHFVILIISSLSAGLLWWKYRLQFKTIVMIISVLISIINTASNLFMFEFDLKLDGYGCPFASNHHAVNTSHTLCNCSCS